MYATTILLSGLAALASASPIERAAAKNEFQVSNFVYGCTAACYWNYDITVLNSTAEHPATGAIHCKGALDDNTSFEASQDVCAPISGTQKLVTYIGRADNVLHIQYSYSNESAGARYWYEGETGVNAVTSGKPQATDFLVEESKAYGVA